LLGTAIKVSPVQTQIGKAVVELHRCAQKLTDTLQSAECDSAVRRFAALALQILCLNVGKAPLWMMATALAFLT